MIGRGRNLSEERSQLALVVRTGESQRLDNFLVNNLAWKSRSRLQNLIRKGRVTVNGEKTKASRRVRLDDVVEIRLSNGLGLPDDYSERKLDIIYEDEWLVAVNKPPGMLVHPVGRHVYDTLINYLHHRYHSPASEGEEIVPKLCHRLDRDTTGVVIVGKKPYVHREVQRQFEKRQVSKTYLALANGHFPPDRGEIDIPSVRDAACNRLSSTKCSGSPAPSSLSSRPTKTAACFAAYPARDVRTRSGFTLRPSAIRSPATKNTAVIPLVNDPDGKAGRCAISCTRNPSVSGIRA